eukprot:2935258-Rhodomonas_salina.2
MKEGKKLKKREVEGGWRGEGSGGNIKIKGRLRLRVEAQGGGEEGGRTRGHVCHGGGGGGPK